jgi:undecaprenyl diphosphate synthase
VKILGDLDALPDDVAEAMRRTEKLTETNQNARLNVCLCYSSTVETYRAIDLLQSKAQEAPITIEDFEKNLFGGFSCKPEIVIRTSNEIRLSNFMLYQSDESQY